MITSPLVNSSQSDNSSAFQSAIDAVEALSLEDRTMLVEIISNRFRQKKREELAEEVVEVVKEYSKGNVKFGSVSDFLEELDDSEG
jgi:adenylate kinase family enzyme